MRSLDMEYIQYGVGLCLLLYCYCLWRLPVALSFFGLTSSALGGFKLLGFSYVKINIALQVLAIFWLLSRLFSERKYGILKGFLGSRYSLVIWALVAVWVKIAIDISYDGMDFYREFSLRQATYLAVLPGLICLLSSALYSGKEVHRQFCLGALLFSIAYLAPTIYPILVEGRIQLAAARMLRLSVYEQDTINGGRFLFVGALALLFTANREKLSSYTRISLWALFSVLVAALFLNATRQYILPVAIAVLAQTYLLGKNRIVLLGAFTCTLLVFGYVVIDVFVASEASERLSMERLQVEAETSRGAIWTDVLYTTLQHPVTGTGFRRYGAVNAVESAEGETVAFLSGAHGVIQEVFVEHGVLLGACLLAAVLQGVVLAIRTATQKENITRAAILQFGGLMCLPFIFSGGITDSFALYFFGALLIQEYVHRNTSETKHRRSVAQMQSRPGRQIAVS